MEQSHLVGWYKYFQHRHQMSYNLGDRSYFLPGNLKIGTAATLLGNDSKLIIAFDLNKLLVPTEPIYGSNGINELQVFGYIFYSPSYNPFLGSRVSWNLETKLC